MSTTAIKNITDGIDPQDPATVNQVPAVAATLVVSVANKAALAALDGTKLGNGAARFVLTYRDWFDLDKTTSRSAIADVVIAATGGGFWVRRIKSDPSWLVQASWFVDPANTSGTASDENSGADGTHQLATRAEFYRRMAETRLAQATTVTIAGSLAGTDTYTSRVATSLACPLNWVGVPVTLFSGVITGYTARNGATSQPTMMTIAGLPVSWTASGLVDKVVEWTDGAGAFIRGIVVADMGSKTAWVSPPINQLNQQNQVFTIGQTVKVYDMPNLGDVSTNEALQTFTYLQATRWILNGGRTDCFNCYGIVTAFGGNYSPVNCNSFPGADDGSHNITTATGATINVIGGKHSVIGSCNMRLSGHATFGTLRPEIGGRYETHVSGGGLATDIEIYNTSPTIAALYFGAVNGGTIIAQGYVYGTSTVVTDAVQFAGRQATLSCQQVPVISGATNIALILAGQNYALTLLGSQEISDVYGNKAFGPPGPSVAVSVTNKAALAAIDVRPLSQGASRFVQTYRAWFDLDLVTTRLAAADTIIAAAGVTGGWWVRRLQSADPFWVAQTAWTVDPAAGVDENLGDSGHPLKTLSEYHRRVWGAQLAADHTITVLSDLNAGDTQQAFFLNDISGVGFTGYAHYFGTPVVKFSGTLDNPSGIVARNGATNQPTLVTCSGLSGTWSNSGPGGTTLVGLIIRRTSDLSTARVVQDMGGKQAWISQPVTPGALPVTWANGDAFVVYDGTSLGSEVNPHATQAEYHDFKVSGRFYCSAGQLSMYNCTGDSISQAGALIYSQNGLSSLVSGASFLVSGGTGSITGGYHRIVCAGGHVRINVTCTIKALQCEGNGVITTLNGGSQGTADMEFNQHPGAMSILNPAINLLGISGGRIICAGYVYGVIDNTAVLVTFGGRSQLFSVAHVPTVTGTLASNIFYQLANLTENVSVLATRLSADVNGNMTVGPTGAGPSLLANGATALALGSTGPNGLPNLPVRYVSWPDGLGGVITIPSWT